jgi:hypothetical protein
MEEAPRKLKKRQKLCHNCEGEIDLEVIVCPFCAADLRTEKPEQGRLSFNTPQMFSQKEASDQHTSQSLYPSPFAPKLSDLHSEQPSQEAPQEDSTNIYGPTIFFTLGFQLVLIGLLMLLFSHNGVVILKLSARWWLFYCIAGCPLLYFGYRGRVRRVDLRRKR